MLSRFQSNAGHEHWVAGKKVLRYLKATKDHLLVYRKLEEQELKVECFTDASYKQDPDDLKSTSGYIFMLAGGAVSWRTNKQELTATSTFQAEYIAIYEATAHALWLRNFVSRLKIVDLPKDQCQFTVIILQQFSFQRTTRGLQHLGIWM